jgi:hypothetical protein
MNTMQNKFFQNEDINKSTFSLTIFYISLYVYYVIFAIKNAYGRYIK